MDFKEYLSQNKLNLVNLKEFDNLRALFETKYGKDKLISIDQSSRLEVVADSIESASEVASKQLGVDISRLDYEIIERGSKGLFGMKSKPFKFIFHSKGAEDFSGSEWGSENFSDFDMQKKSKNFNGKIEIVVTRQGKYIAVHPPKGKGKKVTEAMMLQKLSQKGIENADLRMLKLILKKSKGKLEKIGDWSFDPLKDGKVYLEVSSNRMQAFIRIIPPKLDGREIDLEDIKNLFDERHVVYGFDDKKIESVLKMKNYNIPQLVAEGIKPVAGKGAQLINKLKLKNKIDFGNISDDENIDFKEVSTVVSVVKDQIILEKIMPQKGKDGMSVYGEIVSCVEGKEFQLESGENTYVASNGRYLKASVTGHVVEKGKVFHVKDVYVVQGDVGPQTGHITSLSSVVVNRSVLDGYNIKSGGNIEIKKNVGNCYIEAVGDITIFLGVNGKSSGKLVSTSGSVRAKYLQDCYVRSKKEVLVAESVINCEVNTDESLFLKGKKAGITGGVIRALKEVFCRSLGAVAGAKTEVYVGVLPQIRIGFNKYTKLIEQYDDQKRAFELDIKNLENQQEDGEEKQLKLKEFQNKLNSLEENHVQNKEKLEQIKMAIENSEEEGSVTVLSRMMVGVTLICNTAILENKRDQGASKYIQDIENPEYVKLEAIKSRRRKR